MPAIAAYLNAHGFAVVAQDVRGKFRSDGERFPFVNEAADGHQTIDWIVAQPWSDGTVGMLGDSYYSFTPRCGPSCRASPARGSWTCSRPVSCPSFRSTSGPCTRSRRRACSTEPSCRPNRWPDSTRPLVGQPPAKPARRLALDRRVAGRSAPVPPHERDGS
ncbi:CocE/NonD family hydrolase [Nonomuraea sp. NPDC004186]